jgi:hypothetical protein
MNLPAQTLRSRTAVALCAAVLFPGTALLSGAALLLQAAAPVAAQAQDQALRTVEGKVVDKSGAPIKGAVVYLKDGHTLSVKSYIADDDGSYRFGQLSGSTDYTLWAESDGKKSSTRSISSFDTKKSFDFPLKIDK